MAWVFTNTITTLPYGYYVKVEIIADCGTTGTLTATNGGYIVSIGDFEQAIDEGTGAYKPGEMSIKLRNLSSVFSTNVFNANIGYIELRVWLSWDAGTTYECMFSGFIDANSRTFRDKTTTDATQRIYDVKAYDALISLRDINVTSLAVGNNPPANQVTVANVEGRNIYPGNIVQNLFDLPYDYAYIEEIMLAIVEGIPFIAGATAPTIAISVNMGGGEWESTSVGDNDFSKLAVVWNLPTAGAYDDGYAAFGLETNTGQTQWNASFFSKENLLRGLKLMCESFLLIPIPQLTESGGAYTYTVYFEPMNTTYASISGTLGNLYKKDGSLSLWYDSIEVNTTNLPISTKTTSSFGGKSRTFSNHFCTSPDLGLEHYYVGKVTGVGLGLAPETSNWGFGGQTLHFLKSGTWHTCTGFKVRPGATFAPSTGGLDLGWYGVHESIASMVISSATNALVTRKERKSLSARYKTLRGTSLWDFRPGLDVTIDSTKYRLYKTVKSISKNATNVELQEET